MVLNRRALLLGGAALAGTAVVVGGGFVIHDQWDTRPGRDVIAWLKANALPLATAEPGSGFSDLEPFRAMIGDARIVSMGEATHGTREFFQLKHRLIEYCVSELGFTVIGFEAEYGTTLAVNDYVLHGKGNAVDVVAGMGFWTWNTEEVVALVEWVRAWNASHDRKVKFYGFDMQGSAASGLHLLAYLKRVAPELAVESELRLAPLVSSSTSEDFVSMPKAVQEQVFAQIAAVLAAFAAQRERWISQSSELEWRLVRQSAIAMEQFARSNLMDIGITSMIKWQEHRDQSMADNVRALLDAEGPDARALLWAHNGHVQRAPLRIFRRLFKMTRMGNVLHAAFGPQMVVVGFSFNQGRFLAKSRIDGAFKLGPIPVGPAPAGYLDAALALTGIPLFALDLRRVPPDGPVAKWMAKKPLQRSVGAAVLGDADNEADAADPRSNFDVLVFVDRANASRPNPPRFPEANGTEAGSNKDPTNLALEAGEGAPAGWRVANDSLYPYVVASADKQSPKGGWTVRISRPESPLAWGDGALTQSFPAAPWRGRRLVFSAAMRAEASRAGTGARLVVRAWPQRKERTPLSFTKPILLQQSDGFVRSSDWTRRSIAVDIPRSAESVEISLVVTGDGVGWFGDLELASK
jgi:erythromycin esterase